MRSLGFGDSFGCSISSLEVRREDGLYGTDIIGAFSDMGTQSLGLEDTMIGERGISRTCTIDWVGQREENLFASPSRSEEAAY